MQWFHETEDHPLLYVAEGKGAHFTDVDGHRYLDMNIADMSMFCGYAPEPVVRAVSRARRPRGAVPAAERGRDLGRRGAGAPVGAAEVAVHAVGEPGQRRGHAPGARRHRPRVVLLFDGRYHGHFDEGLVTVRGRTGGLRGGRARRGRRSAACGWSPSTTPTRSARRSRPRDVAVVLTEPAMTNNLGLIQPVEGSTRRCEPPRPRRGTLLAYDETHTLVSGPGGLVRRWGLQPDMVSVGKSIAGGIPLGAWGMTEPLARDRSKPAAGPPLATGGTLFANPLSMAAARATLDEVLTDAAYERTAALGARLADGLEAAIARAGLPWSVHRMFARSGVVVRPRAPAQRR